MADGLDPDVRRIVEHVSRTSNSQDMKKLAYDVLRRLVGPCEATWHEMTCKWHQGHEGYHNAADEARHKYATWEDRSQPTRSSDG